jgi:hypothetical protein
MTKKLPTLSKEELFYYKLRTDKRWFIENFLKIRNKDSELVPFKLNHAQLIVLDLIKECEKEGKMKRFIVLKARQMGLSTLFEALIFQDTVVNQFKNSMIIAHEDKSTQALFSMSKLYYEEMPDVIKPMKKYSNEKALSFENPTSDDAEKAKNPGLRSKITVSTAGTLEAGRGTTVHNLHASEVAFFPDAKTTMLGLLQCVPDKMNTFVALESTANGVGDWFHEMWQKATRGENDFIPVFLPWFIDPGYTRPFRSVAEREQYLEEINQTSYDMQGNVVRTYEYELMTKNNLTPEQMNWRRWAVANKCQGDEELFMQEYPSTPEEAFISSGRPKFSIKSLRKYQTITKEPKRGYLRENSEGKIELIEDAKGYVSIWKEPESNKFYAIGADVAEGLINGDYSCGVVGDSESFDISAMWHGHIDPDLFGAELVKLARYYNDAYLGVESNNHGLTTLTSIKRLEYWNLYFSKTFDRISEQITQKLGWTTSSKTKPLMIDKLAEFVREMHLGIYSDKVISEMFTYVIEDDGKTNAQLGCYDDTVMATAIMLQLLLEGRGDFYVPEVPLEQRHTRPKDVLDPLFEVEHKDEVAE